MIGAWLPLLDGAQSLLAWQPHLDVFAWLFALQGLYLFAMLRLHVRSPETTPISRARVTLFAAGILAIYVAVGTPLDELSDRYLFSAHMLQHLILTMIAPPLLVAGVHDWMLAPLLRVRALLTVGWVLTRPLVAFTIFNLSLLVVHLPAAIALELQHESTIHFGAHALLLVSGMLMWWPVLSPSRLLPPISYPAQMVYLFLQSFVPAVLSAFIIFTDNAFYNVYASAPRLWGLSLVDDQRIGGLIMKLAGTVILWGFMTVVFFKWFEQEERDEPPMPAPPPVLIWEDVEEELVRMGLTEREVSPRLGSDG